MLVKKNHHWTHYERRLGRVISYIYNHLHEELDLLKLAEVACLSPYHWHRIYHALYGETITATVKRLRLHHAAGLLAQTSMPITEVAESSGYDNLQSFTRIFKSVYGMPPAKYRQSGSHMKFQSSIFEGEQVMYQVSIQDIAGMRVLSVPHNGSYMAIGKAFAALYRTLAARNQFDTGMRSVGIYYDDPSLVAEQALRSRACVVVDDRVVAEAPLQEDRIVGGRCAVLRHQGPYADMRSAYQWLYGQWLVAAGEEVGDTPVFEEYLNNPRDTAPADLLTDIYLPLCQ